MLTSVKLKCGIACNLGRHMGDVPEYHEPACVTVFGNDKYAFFFAKILYDGLRAFRFVNYGDSFQMLQEQKDVNIQPHKFFESLFVVFGFSIWKNEDSAI